MLRPSEISVDELLTRWWGTPSESVPQLPGRLSWLPEPLINHHRMLLRWSPSGFNETLLVPLGQVIPQGEKVVFMKDSTGDWLWAFDSEDQNSVYECALGEPWDVVNESLPETLTHQFLFDLARMSPVRIQHPALAEHLIAEMIAEMEEVRFGGWRWPLPGGRIFIGDGVVMTVGPAVSSEFPWGPQPGFFTVRLGASSSVSLEAFRNIAS